jgi:hypothetical protein
MVVTVNAEKVVKHAHTIETSIEYQAIDDIVRTSMHALVFVVLVSENS